MRADSATLERPVDVPARRWPKALAFSVGFAAAIGAYVFARPRLATWRSWVTTHLASAASSAGGSAVAATAPGAAPSTPRDLQAGPPPYNTASSDDAPLGTQAASRSMRRHRPRHRRASKR